MITGKKAIFFTLASILIISILVASMKSVDYITMKDRIPVIKNRVLVADDYVRNLEKSYFETALTYSSQNAMQALTEYMETQNEFLTNVTLNFTYVLINGTLNGRPLTDYGITTMEGNTLSDKLNEISDASEDTLHITTNITILNISIYQSEETGPWKIGIKMCVNASIDAGIVSWNVTDVINTTVDITNFDDPYMYVNTGGAFNREIRPTNNTLWNKDFLELHILNGTYMKVENAPDFLTRLENKTNASACCGIETLINSSFAYDENPDISLHRYLSYADYCFFGGFCAGSDPRETLSLYNVSGITTDSFKFWIEPYHIQLYNLPAGDVEKVTVP